MMRRSFYPLDFSVFNLGLIYLSLLIIFLICAMSQKVRASVVDEIALDVVQVLSQSWPQGGGMYRVVVRNTEQNPCLSLQSINVIEDRMQYSRAVCPRDFKIAGTSYRIDQLSGFFYDDLQMVGPKLHIYLDVFPLLFVSFRAKCALVFSHEGIATPSCKKIEAD